MSEQDSGLVVKTKGNLLNLEDWDQQEQGELSMETAFHLALGVSDLQKARDFYTGLLGAREGRSDSLWVDFDFFGHQLTCHLIEGAVPSVHYNPVDRQSVPIPHFGPVVDPKNLRN